MWKIGIVAVALAGTAWAQVTQRVSLDSNGVQENLSCTEVAISSDGRYVVFGSNATNLVSGDSNGWIDIFVRDRELGLTERVSVSSAGMEANGQSFAPSISADGRCVVFYSEASDLVLGDLGGWTDVFARDRELGVTECASVDSAGAQGNGASSEGAISADGRFVVFVSNASNLVPGDTNGGPDVFVRDRLLGTTERASLDSAGAEVDGGYSNPAISPDGRYVVFESNATNLVVGDTNGRSDIFIRDRHLGLTERVSVDSAGVQGNNDSAYPSVDSDGRFVAFNSFASNLVAGDTFGRVDVFVRDRQLGVTERVSVDSSGAQAFDNSYRPSISADGRIVAFVSMASNLVSGDTNAGRDIFVRDRQLAVTERVSVSSAGAQANGESTTASLSADGRYVVFGTGASNLISGDSNGMGDGFVRNRFGGPTFTSVCSPGVAGVIGCPCSNPPLGPGQGCDNSSATGGATLSASGGTYLSSDSLEFLVTGGTPNALSLLLQGTALIPSGVVYGQGVRCVGGAMTRLLTKRPGGGSLTVPDFSLGEPAVSSLSEAKGDLIQAGHSRSYLVVYRDPTILGGCSVSSTFNATQTGRVTWSP